MCVGALSLISSSCDFISLFSLCLLCLSFSMFYLFFILSFISPSLSLSFHLFLSWPDGRNKRKATCMGLGPFPVCRIARTCSSLLYRDKLHVVDRHLCLAAWSQPSDITFLRTSVTLFLKRVSIECVRCVAS